MKIETDVDLKKREQRRKYAARWRTKNMYEHREYMREYCRQYRADPEGAAKCKAAEAKYRDKKRSEKSKKSTPSS